MYVGGNMNYIGSKFSILSYIDEVVEDFTKLGKKVIFCDIFSGTGVVSKYFKEKGKICISKHTQKAYLQNFWRT